MTEKRILLTPIDKQDAREITAGLNNTDLSNLAQLAGGDMRIEDERKKIRLFQNDPTKEIYSIRTIQDDELVIIGTIGLNEIDRHSLNGRIGMIIFDAYGGKGYAKEAIRELVKMYFNKYKYIKIYANIFVENLKSNHIFYDCGFELSGTRPKHYFQGGRFHDMLELSIINRKRIQEIEGGRK